MDINSKNYWNSRFSNDDWKKYGGDQQSVFFSELFIQEMPEWLRADLCRNSWKIADYGCAEGDGSAVLGSSFFGCSVTGYDFSEAAIDKAKMKHQNCNFEVADIYEDLPETDVVFSSNTLEHLQDPHKVFRRFIESSRKYTVLLLPFEDDYGFDEHINTFTAEFFPDTVSNHYLSFFKVIDCREKNIPYWPGKQILLVYTNRLFRAPSNYNIAKCYDECFRKYVEDMYQTKMTAKQEIVEQLDQFQKECDNQLKSMSNELIQYKTTMQKQQEELEMLSGQHQKDLENLMLQQQELILNTRHAVNHLINVCNQLQCQKSFKLIHFLKRIRNQFFKGTQTERKKFLKWLFSRFKKRPDNDIRFKPLNEIVTLLLELQNDLLKSKCTFLNDSIALPGAVTGIPAKCLEQIYDKPDVIIFSVINYEFRFQRPQHFAKRFAENGHRVFYINANFTNPESTKEIETGLFTVNFMSVDCKAIYYSDSWDGFENWLKEKMDTLVQTYAIRDAIVVLDFPNWIECAEYLREIYGFKMVADYMDDATGFLNTTTETLKENCLRMLKNCDLIIPSSQFLYDIAKQYNDKLVVIRNGTEVYHFQQALDIEVKQERPVIGYYGAVSHWFAWETVCYLAKNLPNCDIVIIGSVTEHNDKLNRYKNIKLLGEIDYQYLPEHLAYFDVCLIPFDTSTDLIKATNPVKFYEYLSAGKPIVATEIPELEPFRDQYVYMSNDKKQFLEYVKLCLSGKDTLATKEECIAFASKNDWQNRYEAFANACTNVIPKVSIIVLTYNNLKLNKYCISSILNQTAYPNYELIVLDNLSTDGTVEYLRELEQQNHPRLKIVFNTENSGFAGGNNKAIKLSSGKYVILLNNDTVITRGWLTAMVKHLENDPQCGMVGAVTNSIGNEAMIAAAYRNLNELARFAYAYTRIHNNEINQDVDRLALFCTMIRRDILDQHGMLDDGYKVGMFEDDDLAMIVKKAGYHFYAVEDCFIHHVNNASFKKLHPEEYQKIFDTNRARYEKKWNTTWTLPKYREGVTYDINANVMTEPVEA